MDYIDPDRIDEVVYCVSADKANPVCRQCPHNPIYITDRDCDHAHSLFMNCVEAKIRRTSHDSKHKRKNSKVR